MGTHLFLLLHTANVTMENILTPIFRGEAMRKLGIQNWKVKNGRALPKTQSCETQTGKAKLGWRMTYQIWETKTEKATLINQSLAISF